MLADAGEDLIPNTFVVVSFSKFVTNSVSYSNKVAEEMPKEIFNEDDYVPYIGNEIPVDLRINLKIGIRIGGNN
jgi:hypothetical protein